MNKEHLNTMFQSSQLFGIFSNSKRVAVVDSLLHQTDKLIIPNKHSVMCVNMIPMMVYLTNPSSYKGWKFIDPEKKRKELMQNEAPDFIIISHKNTRDRYWPNTKSACISMDSVYYEFYRKFLDEPIYDLAYKNSCFSIYKNSLKSFD